jgi:hypothetical protein
MVSIFSCVFWPFEFQPKCVLHLNWGSCRHQVVECCVFIYSASLSCHWELHPFLVQWLARGKHLQLPFSSLFSDLHFFCLCFPSSPLQFIVSVQVLWWNFSFSFVYFLLIMRMTQNLYSLLSWRLVNLKCVLKSLLLLHLSCDTWCFSITIYIFLSIYQYFSSYSYL